MPTFWRVFIINGCWVLLKTFSVSINLIICFLSFTLLVSVKYHTDWFVNIVESLHPWNKTPFDNGIWSFYYVVGFHLLEFCWGFWHPCSSVILACSFCLFIILPFWHLCLVLVSGQWWPHRMHLGVFLPLQISGRVLAEQLLALLFKFLVKFTCDIIWFWASVCWKIFYYDFDSHACD